MGRYYDGDISGKFWFGVQSSSDADHFGVKGTVPNQLNYYFHELDIPCVEKKLAEIMSEMGQDFNELANFFTNNNGYNDEMIVEQTKIPKNRLKSALGLYARYQLGNEILMCLHKHQECSFTAEL